jgi:micrococcal nuclease
MCLENLVPLDVTILETILFLFFSLARNDIIHTISFCQQFLANCLVIFVDGDTFDCKFGWTRTERIRLIGVDTPETKHPKKPVQFYGKEASRCAKNMLSGGEVGLEYDVQQCDKYGRVLAYVYLKDGRMFNALLVREGYAKVSTYPPNVKYQKLFAELPKEARENGKGLWGE